MSPGKDDFDPTQSATARLMWHITEKGFQLGACIGSAVVVPVMLYRGRGSNVPVLPKLLRGLAKTTVITTGVTGVLGLGRIYGTPLTSEGIEDRVYRLHYNQGQNRTDVFSTVGAVTGAAAAAAKFGVGGASLIGGAAFGTSLAVLAHVATHEEAEKGLKTGPSNMINELKRKD